MTDLASAASRMGVPLAPGAADLLGRLLAMVREESANQNLTAILEPGDMVVDHLLDSLALAPVAAAAGVPLAQGALGVDVGTGAGFPGIPLAVAFPATRWVLVESEGRKVEWLGGALEALGIRNAEVFRGRAREVRHRRPDLEGAVDLVTARAVGDLGRLCREARGLLRPGGVLLCPKGRALDAAEMALGEREARKSRLEPAGVLPMEVPGRERACVVYRRIAPPPGPAVTPRRGGGPASPRSRPRPR
jgi:16S rRNA (guanine527-N7)-methyltransferase